MRHNIILLTIISILVTSIFLQAGNDRSIHRKDYTYGKENKVALVIGNKNYTRFSPLKNTLNDAKDMRNVLKAKGFDVLYLEDGDLESMETMVEKFVSKLRKGGVGFFYYAGHGLEVEGKNYLVPIGANISKKNKVKYKSLPINLVIDEMEDSHNRLNIIVLDACRNDPFSRGGGGLAQINNAEGMYIAFATAPGKVADDGGSGRNGLFTRHLIRNINQTNLTLDQVFNKTRESVNQESNKKQTPWSSSSVMGEFYFQVAPLGTPVIPPTLDTTTRTETIPAEEIESEAYQKWGMGLIVAILLLAVMVFVFGRKKRTIGTSRKIESNDGVRLVPDDSTLPLIMLHNHQSITVGRSGACDIVIDQNEVSQEHLSLTWSGSVIETEDMDSTNGSYIGTKRLKPHHKDILREGEQLRIGSEKILYTAMGLEDYSLDTAAVKLIPKNSTLPLIVVHDRLLVGRSDECNVTIKHDEVSRIHLEIKLVKNKIVIQDLDSANGTYINGVRVDAGKSISLKAGDILGIGGDTIVYEIPKGV